MATLDPEFDRRIRALLSAAQAQGYSPQVASGYRSPQDQARAIDSVSRNVQGRPASFVDFARGIPGYAAPVGGSKHQQGLAADLTGSGVDWARQNAAAYGISFPKGLSRTDPNHAEVDPNFWGPVQDPRDRAGPVAEIPKSKGAFPAPMGLGGPVPRSQDAEAQPGGFYGQMQPTAAGAATAEPVAPITIGSTGSAPMALGMGDAPQPNQGGFDLNNWFTSPLFLMGASVLGSQNLGQGLSQGAQTAASIAAGKRKEAKDAELFPLQKQLLAAQVAQANRPPTSDDIKEFQFAKGDGFTGTFADWMKQKREMNGQTAQQVTWGTDANGNFVAMQASRDGKLVQSATPHGVTPVPAEVLAYRRAQATQQGEAAGKAKVDLPAVESNAKVMKDAIDAIENDAYLPKMTGYNSYLPNVSPKSKETQARIDQVQGKAFLQAFQGLRGGGAITEAEGAKATASLSRLQQLGVGTPEYRKALQDLKGEVDELVSLARRKATNSDPAFSLKPADRQQPPTDLGNGIRIRRLD